ncbi:hypothetical protein GCM10010430_63810 [Kitasatospora cystarginea]|uniref:Uncharacterized protein n=1 Tax=Kitasatospora cystarginea TaxID=58350 RepID=A0ABP5RT04_9ACTN
MDWLLCLKEGGLLDRAHAPTPATPPWLADIPGRVAGDLHGRRDRLRPGDRLTDEMSVLYAGNACDLAAESATFGPMGIPENRRSTGANWIWQFKSRGQKVSGPSLPPRFQVMPRQHIYC